MNQKLKIGIIGAMEQEVEILLSKIQNTQKHTIINTVYYEGEINGIKIALLQSGIGKVAAAMTTAVFIDLTKTDFIINTGSAGGLSPTLTVGDIVLSSSVAYHDVDLTAFGYERGALPASPRYFTPSSSLLNLAVDCTKELKLNAVSGLICSGDRFVNGKEALAEIKQNFPEVAAVEMEAAAIAQVCHAYKLPFVVVRAISDSADKESHLSFDEFLPLAAKKSTDMLLLMIEKIATGYKI